jgi:hypothetical protein
MHTRAIATAALSTALSSQYFTLAIPVEQSTCGPIPAYERCHPSDDASRDPHPRPIAPAATTVASGSSSMLWDVGRWDEGRWG